MRDLRKKVLLGVDINKEIVFGEMEITHRNGYPEFSASFDTVRPFNGDDLDLEEYFEDYADEKYSGADFVLEQCRNHHCSPQDLPRELAEECDDPRDAFDCSLFPEEYEIIGKYGNIEHWYFESGSCGQHDTREYGMEKYVDKKAYDELHKLWDKYHLKKVNEKEITKQMEEIERKLNVDWEDWIAEYIRRELM
jgi:hypothetical protein